MAARALAPTSSIRAFFRSSSSTTTRGSTTSCSSNLSGEWGSARRTQVSRTKVPGTWSVSFGSVAKEHSFLRPAPNYKDPRRGGSRSGT